MSRVGVEYDGVGVAHEEEDGVGDVENVGENGTDARAPGAADEEAEGGAVVAGGYANADVCVDADDGGQVLGQ